MCSSATRASKDGRSLAAKTKSRSTRRRWGSNSLHRVFDFLRFLEDRPHRRGHIFECFLETFAGWRFVGDVANQDSLHLLRKLACQNAVRLGIFLARVTDEHEAA